MECLNTNFQGPTLLCEGFSIKLNIYKNLIFRLYYPVQIKSIKFIMKRQDFPTEYYKKVIYIMYI